MQRPVARGRLAVPGLGPCLRPVRCLWRHDRQARKKLEKFNPLYRQAWLKAVCQVTITDLLFCGTLVFFAAALYNADPFAIYSSNAAGLETPGGSWHQVQQSCGLRIDGRLPVVLLLAPLWCWPWSTAGAV